MVTYRGADGGQERKVEKNKTSVNIFMVYEPREYMTSKIELKNGFNFECNDF